jgi:hypothetical protein
MSHLPSNIVDDINKLASFIKEEERESKSKKRPRCPSCDDGIHQTGHQTENEYKKRKINSQD